MDAASIDRARLAELASRERAQYAVSHPASMRAFDAAGRHLLGGVPMTWMRMWPGGFPLYLATAHGARVTDIDGNIFADFCLGDTGAMAGHSPAQVQAAVAERYGELGGATAMLPTVPDRGYLAEVRRLTREYGILLINDETHTFSAGPGGCTMAWGLDPDIVTIGKAIGGGIASGAYGLSAALGERIIADDTADLIDHGGIGGTLAGNALSVAAMRATLEHVLTGEAFEVMIGLADRYATGIARVIESRGLPWHIVRLGARAEYRFCPWPPRSGGESHAAADPALDDYLHLYLANRGVLLTPFHNMALMCPATTDADVDAHTALFATAVDDLIG